MTTSNVELTMAISSGWIKSGENIILLGNSSFLGTIDPRYYDIDISMSSKGISVEVFRNNKCIPATSRTHFSFSGIDVCDRSLNMIAYCDVDRGVEISGLSRLSADAGISIHHDAVPHVISNIRP
ncbi:4 protein [Cytorhabdovirus hordei]|uniref:4 protein n=1 Tax=Cytorhabdovirus hordei TaxID=1985699 RepID=A0A0C5KP01_9RHAB|nr:4 protein [Cytorhabdovirus hordei]AJP67518.1 4 protein [Cytorhabdovirus hordei]